MARDPAILFYTSDFLTGTAFFTDEQRGQYIRLLCEQHQNGHIPENHMVNVCLSLGSPVVKKFVKDENGFYYNERMEQEIIKRFEFTESRRINGQKGGRPKENNKPNGKANGKAKNNLIENENENILNSFIDKFNSITGKKIRVFDEKAKKQLKARLKEGFSIDEIYCAIENCKNDKWHIENPKYLTPEFITRADKLQQYLNAKTTIESNGKKNNGFVEVKGWVMK